MTNASAPQNKPSRWGVVCTCLEPTQLVVAFVAHYIALGADRLWIFLDAPQPDLETILAQIPQVNVTVCDRAYWKNHVRGRRPRSVELRQNSNAFDAYSAADVDWLLHVDADEFLHTDFPVADILNAYPDEVDYVLVRPRERAFLSGTQQETLFDGLFRRPTPQSWAGVPSLFGKAEEFFHAGMLAHRIGKSFFRTNTKLIPGIHTPRKPRSLRDETLLGSDMLRMRLLHFDGLTGLHWASKLLRAAQSARHTIARKPKGGPTPRMRQINWMQENGSDLQGAWNMHSSLKCLDGAEAARLRALGLVEDHLIDPAKDIQALGLDQSIDLSRAAFDAALAADTPQIANWLTEWQTLINKEAQ